MATTDVYYTVEAFVSALIVTSQPEERSIVASSDDICSTTKNLVWNYFGTRGGFIPLTNGTVSNEQLICYVIRVWKEGSNGSASLVNSDGVKIGFDTGYTLRTWADSNNKVARITGIQNVHGGSSNFSLNQEPPKFVSAGYRHAYFSGDAFYLYAYPIAGKTGSIGVPPVRVTLTKNSTLNTSASDYEVPASKYRKKPLAVTFTAGKGNATQIPSEVSNAVTVGGYGGLCPCDGLWYVLEVGIQQTISNVGSSALKNRYKGTINVYDEHGNKKTSLTPTYDINAIAVGGTDSEGRPNILPDQKDGRYVAAKKVIQSKTNCLATTNNGNGGGNGGGGNDPGKAAPYDTTEPQENPPNHFYTRDIPYMKRQMSGIGVENGGRGLDFETPGFTNNLGYCYQDKQSAETQNSTGKLRFHFNYNPTTLAYTTQSNTSIDWTLGNADPANVLGGNTAVSCTLYLNRIADMTELRKAVGQSAYSINYPRALGPKEIAGILSRGTEYDLEFFYRIVNGNPEDASQGLLQGSVGAKSSDFGYVTGIPFWIKFHDNLRYKVSLNSIQVNHVLFTEDMVPMLSTVDVSMTRIPAFGDIDPAIEAVFQNSTATVRKTVTGGLGTK
jgi:hypothetical protein